MTEKRVLVIVAAMVATIAAAVFAGSGNSASRGSHSLTIGVSGTAIFTGTDLICVNEPPQGAPRFKTSGVACSSYKQPYNGIGVWITKTKVIITSPPNGRIRAVFSR